MLETKLISPSGEIYSMYYYEIGLFAEKMCRQYIEKNDNNQLEFETFASNYTYFKPYFDFLIFKLGYKIINPFFKDNTVGYSIGNYFITKGINKDDNIQMEKYSSVSDSDLQITNYKDISLKEGFIDQNGIGFKVNRNIDMSHSKVCELILNQIMIYNKEICEDYLKSIHDPEIKNILTRIEFYMIERLGFIQMCIFETNFGDILYNDKLLPKWFDDFKQIFEKEYEYVSFDSCSEEINLDPFEIRKLG